jgi:hypothetical protein
MGIRSDVLIAFEAEKHPDFVPDMKSLEDSHSGFLARSATTVRKHEGWILIQLCSVKWYTDLFSTFSEVETRAKQAADGSIVVHIACEMGEAESFGNPDRDPFQCNAYVSAHVTFEDVGEEVSFEATCAD